MKTELYNNHDDIVEALQFPNTVHPLLLRLLTTASNLTVSAAEQYPCTPCWWTVCYWG